VSVLFTEMTDKYCENSTEHEFRSIDVILQQVYIYRPSCFKTLITFTWNYSIVLKSICFRYTANISVLKWITFNWNSF